MATAKYRSPADLYIPSLGLHVAKGETFESAEKLGAPFEKVGAAKPKAKRLRKAATPPETPPEAPEAPATTNDEEN